MVLAQGEEGEEVDSPVCVAWAPERLFCLPAPPAPSTPRLLQDGRRLTDLSPSPCHLLKHSKWPASEWGGGQIGGG